jgi:hypothetical protein
MGENVESPGYGGAGAASEGGRWSEVSTKRRFSCNLSSKVKKWFASMKQAKATPKAIDDTTAVTHHRRCRRRIAWRLSPTRVERGGEGVGKSISTAGSSEQGASSSFVDGGIDSSSFSVECDSAAAGGEAWDCMS